MFSNDETRDASLRGRMKRGQKMRVLVGDDVLLDEHPDGSVTIEEINERRNVLKRRAPGKTRRTRTVAANIDQVIVVGAADRPRWDPQVMDKFLVVAEANGLSATVVVNKADLAEDAEPLGAAYRAAGYEVLVTSVPNALGVDRLRRHLAGKVSLLTGATGVGKSSLLNAVQPGLSLRTGKVSRRGGSGRHTTTAAEMYPLNDGGFVVDTPGLRDIGLWAVDPIELGAAFPEFAKWIPSCRFGNCRHMEEPGCAVSDAAAGGEINQTRLESYRRLLEEAIQAARHWEG